jgi:ABC-type glycerol-3-phosphate transport system substrate-binding protein
MANEQNLKPQNQRTKSEQRKIAQMGGIASGEKRRHQRDLREAVKAVQGVILPVKGGGEGKTVVDAVALAVAHKAAQGDLKAAALLWEWLYGKQTKVDVTSSDGSMSPNQINLGDRTTEELMQMFKALGSGSGDEQGAS